MNSTTLERRLHNASRQIDSTRRAGDSIGTGFEHDDNIVRFATDQLGLDVFPWQATLLKVLTCSEHLLTEFDRSGNDSRPGREENGEPDHDHRRYHGGEPPTSQEPRDGPAIQMRCSQQIEPSGDVNEWAEHRDDQQQREQRVDDARGRVVARSTGRTPMPPSVSSRGVTEARRSTRRAGWAREGCPSAANVAPPR